MKKRGENKNGKVAFLTIRVSIHLNSLITRDEKTEFANSLDLDEVAQHHPDLQCLLSNLGILNVI